MDYIIEAYLENPEGFQGAGDLLTKFGVAQQDEITMGYLCSKI